MTSTAHTQLVASDFLLFPSACTVHHNCNRSSTLRRNNYWIGDLELLVVQMTLNKWEGGGGGEGALGLVVWSAAERQSVQ